MTPINLNRQRGFALLMSLLIIGVVISVTMTIVELSLKQLGLSVSARDSEVAFAAANAGLECAQRIRHSASTTIEIGTRTNFDCFEQTVNNVDKEASLGFVVSGDPNYGKVFRYKNSIDWGSGVSGSNDRCSEIDIVAMVTKNGAAGDLVIGGNGNNHSLKKVFSGYPNNTKSCNPGGRCTLAVVRGYSAKCADKSNPGTLMREILLEF